MTKIESLPYTIDAFSRDMEAYGIPEDLQEHLQGKHSQKAHGRRKAGNFKLDKNGMAALERITSEKLVIDLGPEEPRGTIRNVVIHSRNDYPYSIWLSSSGTFHEAGGQGHANSAESMLADAGMKVRNQDAVPVLCSGTGTIRTTVHTGMVGVEVYTYPTNGQLNSLKAISKSSIDTFGAPIGFVYDIFGKDTYTDGSGWAHFLHALQSADLREHLSGKHNQKTHGRRRGGNALASDLDFGPEVDMKPNAVGSFWLHPQGTFHVAQGGHISHSARMLKQPNADALDRELAFDGIIQSGAIRIYSTPQVVNVTSKPNISDTQYMTMLRTFGADKRTLWFDVLKPGWKRYNNGQGLDNFFTSVEESLKEHLPGKHDQKTHGRRHAGNYTVQYIGKKYGFKNPTSVSIDKVNEAMENIPTRFTEGISRVDLVDTFGEGLWTDAITMANYDRYDRSIRINAMKIPGFADLQALIYDQKELNIVLAHEVGHDVIHYQIKDPAVMNAIRGEHAPDKPSVLAEWSDLTRYSRGQDPHSTEGQNEIFCEAFSLRLAQGIYTGSAGEEVFEKLGI